jgi:hypothetical protein
MDLRAAHQSSHVCRMGLVQEDGLLNRRLVRLPGLTTGIPSSLTESVRGMGRSRFPLPQLFGASGANGS